MIPLEHIIEVALLVLFAYLAGCGVGYSAHWGVRAFSARPRFDSAAVAKIVEQAATPPASRRSAARRLAGAVEREDLQPAPTNTPVQQRPPDLPAPRNGKPDNLREIRGIGPKTESALNDLGIYHHDQVAAWTAAQVDWLEGRIAIKGRIRREQWVEQAVLLVTAPA